MAKNYYITLEVHDEGEWPRIAPKNLMQHVDVRLPHGLTIAGAKVSEAEVNTAKNLSGVKSESPRPAQVEGLATPRPWRHQTEDGALGSIVGVNGYPVGHTFARLGDDHHVERQANAALIVRAVNSFDALVEALRSTDNGHGHFAGCVRDTPPDDARPCRRSCEITRAALKLAEGK